MKTTRTNKPSALEQFKLKATILGLVAVGALGTAGILYESSTWNPKYTPINQAIVTNQTATAQSTKAPTRYIKTAFDGTRVLVEENPVENQFSFYRDKDNDGWADTQGKGFYDPLGSGLSRHFKEEAITPYTVRISTNETEGVEAQ